MEPFLFHPVRNQAVTDSFARPEGPIDSQYCYGVFHEPQSHFMADHSVLFVYPWGQDYVRSHRALRKIALNLQRQGVASLRFDFRGTGDSGGDHCDVSLETMIADVQSAYAYLKEHTGSDRIKVVGVRLGALLALKALGKIAHEVLCWDPVLFGDVYIQELYGPTITSRTVEPGVTWINGYPLTQTFELELRSTFIEPSDIVSPVQLYGAEQTLRFKKWLDVCVLENKRVQLLHEVQPGEGSIWGNINSIGGFVNPRLLLQRLEEQLLSGTNFGEETRDGVAPI